MHVVPKIVTPLQWENIQMQLFERAIHAPTPSVFYSLCAPASSPFICYNEKITTSMKSIKYLKW